MKGYIVYADYKIKNDSPIIELYGRLENNQSFKANIPFKPFFYIKTEDKIKALEVLENDIVDLDMKDFNDNPVSKVIFNKPTDSSTIRKLYEDQGIVTFESDIRLVMQYFIEKNIMGAIELDGEYIKGEKVDRIYKNPDIKETSEYDIKLNTISVDIETNKTANRVYSISIVGDGISEAHILSDKNVKNATSYTTEKSLLKGFVDRVNEIDPDIIVGWNFIDFDMDVLRRRMKDQGIRFAIGRNDEEVKIRIQQDFFRDSSCDAKGRIIFDGISLLKQAFISFPDYKLDTVAENILREKKLELEDDFWDRFEDIMHSNPYRVVEYNIKDSKLVYDILKKKKLIELMLKKSIITGMQLDKVKGSVASLDSVYIRHAHKRGYVCPNSGFGHREERVKGAYVKQPIPGIYDWVAVLDFKSLYPSLIRTYNIDPLFHKPTGTIIAPNGTRFIDGEGVLPEIIKNLWKERDLAKKEKDDEKSYAIKIIMNSFYGVLANPSCRFYNLDMANAITGYARETIKETERIIEKNGYHVLYGDTDSVFVDMKVNNFADAQKLGDKISSQINDYFTKQVKEKYGRKSILELEFEKMFKVLMLPKARGSETGAKKRYAGLLVKNGEEKIKVTGMEVVRRDWTDLAKEIQMELLDRVFHKKEVDKYIKKIVDEVKEGQHDKKLVYAKSITKNLEEYTKTTPPHVKAARMLPKLKSKIIKYCMTINGPEPIELLSSPLDYDHYIEKQIKPIAESILNLLGKSFDDAIRNSNQKSLFEF